MTQGYCPVCEDYLRLPAGVLCPKHDLPLETQAPPRPRLDDGGKPLRWVTIARYPDTQAADAPRIRLEAEGIPTFIDGERMGARSMYHVATGGVKLKVPESLATDARILLSQTWSATAAGLGIDESFGDLDDHVDDACPESAPTQLSALRRFWREMIFASVAVPLVLAVLYLLYLLLHAGPPF
jgi:hypothetical protein